MDLRNLKEIISFFQDLETYYYQPSLPPHQQKINAGTQRTLNYKEVAPTLLPHKMTQFYLSKFWHTHVLEILSKWRRINITTKEAIVLWHIIIKISSHIKIASSSKNTMDKPRAGIEKHAQQCTDFLAL